MSILTTYLLYFGFMFTLTLAAIWTLLHVQGAEPRRRKQPRPLQAGSTIHARVSGTGSAQRTARSER